MFYTCLSVILFTRGAYATHTPLPCMPPSPLLPTPHTPLPCTLPATHAPCHDHPPATHTSLPRRPPPHTPNTHTPCHARPLSCTPPCHARPPSYASHWNAFMFFHTILFFTLFPELFLNALIVYELTIQFKIAGY